MPAFAAVYVAAFATVYVPAFAEIYVPAFETGTLTVLNDFSQIVGMAPSESVKRVVIMGK